MLSSDIVYAYECNPDDPMQIYRLCTEGIEVMLNDTPCASKEPIIRGIDSAVMLTRNPFARYLLMMAILRRIELSNELDTLEGYSIFQGHIALVDKGLHGPTCLTDEYSDGLKEFVKREITHLVNVRNGVGKESIVTAYSPIVPYVGTLTKPEVSNELIEVPDQAKIVAARKIRALMMDANTCINIMRHYSELKPYLNNPAGYIVVSPNAFPGVCVEYLQMCNVFEAPSAEMAVRIANTRTGVGNISTAVESMVDVLKDFEDETLEDELDQATNTTILAASKLAHSKDNANGPFVYERQYDIRTIISNIQLQRRFRPSAYTTTGALDVPHIAGVTYYDNYVLIEPRGNDGDSEHGELSDFVYVPVIDDLSGANEMILKCWKDGRRIEVLNREGFRNELYHRPDTKDSKIGSYP